MATAKKAAPKVSSAKKVTHIKPELEDHIAGIKEVLEANGKLNDRHSEIAHRIIRRDIDNGTVYSDLSDTELNKLLNDELPFKKVPLGIQHVRPSGERQRKK
jgi:hypothetical protein